MSSSKYSFVMTSATSYDSSVTPGEVFVLLTRLNEDWGWGRSQRTGDSGLIPLSVMEKVVSVC